MVPKATPPMSSSSQIPLRRTAQLLLPDIICLQEVQIDRWDIDKDDDDKEKKKQNGIGVGLRRAIEEKAVSVVAEAAAGSAAEEDIKNIDDDDDVDAAAPSPRSRRNKNRHSYSYYDSYLQNVTKGHPVANAILVRRNFAKCLAVESRSRALIAVLELLRDDDDGSNDDNNIVVLANVHLQGGMDSEQEETRFYQLKSLLKRIDKHVQEYCCCRAGEVPPIILVGDFNMRRDNPLYHVLKTGQFPSAKKKTSDAAAAATNASPAHRSRLETTTAQLTPLLSRNDRERQLPYLPLRDGYSECRPEEGPVDTTYSGGAVLDYLWVSDSVSVHETWRSYPEASVDTDDDDDDVDTSTATSARAVAPRRTRTPPLWPDADHPSDHLPIGAVLSIK